MTEDFFANNLKVIYSFWKLWARESNRMSVTFQINDMKKYVTVHVLLYATRWFCLLDLYLHFFGVEE